jgi:hypothetical protein
MVAGVARGNLITNGSFETPVVPVGGFTNYLAARLSLRGGRW